MNWSECSVKPQSKRVQVRWIYWSWGPYHRRTRMRTVLPWARAVTITAAGRGVSHDNGSQTMNERPDGRRDTSKHVVLNRGGFQTRSVLRLRDNCWISGGASCSGGRAGRGGDRTNRRPRERSLNASGIFTDILWIWRVDWGKSRSDGPRLGPFGRWQVQIDYMSDSDSKAARFIQNLSSADPAVRISRRYTSYLMVLWSSSRLDAPSPVLSHGLLAGDGSSVFIIKSIHCLVCSGSVGLSGPVLGFLDTQYYPGFYNDCKLSLLKVCAEI